MAKRTWHSKSHMRRPKGKGTPTIRVKGSQKYRRKPK